jgi:hypothetical protein
LRAGLAFGGDLLAQLAEHPVGLTVDVGGVERIAILEVAVQRRAGTPRRLGDLVHAHSRRIVLREQFVGGVEDPIRRGPGPAFGQPVGHYWTEIPGRFAPALRIGGIGGAEVFAQHCRMRDHHDLGAPGGRSDHARQRRHEIGMQRRLRFVEDHQRRRPLAQQRGTPQQETQCAVR